MAGNEQSPEKNQLEQGLTNWQVTFDAIIDPILILDKDLNIVKANKAATNVFGQQEQCIEGKKCFQVFAGSDEQCKFCPVPVVILEKETYSQEIKSRYLGKIFSIACTPILVEEEIVGYIHSAKDTSLKHQLEKQLIQVYKMDAIATLAGGIAHDFNNILGAIMGNADLLLHRLPDDQQEQLSSQVSVEEIVDHLKSIRRAGNRAKKLVAQILEFSRQSTNKMEVILLTPLIEECCKFLRSSYPATIDLKVTVERVGGILADHNQVQQVLMILCNNAVQALDNSAGAIEVSLREIEVGSKERQCYNELGPGKYVALSVRDTGRGMPEDILQRIFDPFFTTQDVGDGSGMGLAVLHGIILSHNGVIDVQSSVRKGSVFTVFFPRVNDRWNENDSVIRSNPRGTETILFVDDEEEIVIMRKRMLEYLGYRVLPASNPEKALEYFSEGLEKIDLLITDHTMPGMTGLELAKKALEYNQDLPVILCSGYSDTVTTDETGKAGIQRFLPKPLDMRLLANAIREILPNQEDV